VGSAGWPWVRGEKGNLLNSGEPGTEIGIYIVYHEVESGNRPVGIAAEEDVFAEQLGIGFLGDLLEDGTQEIEAGAA
jgi:hypothetical protein